MKKLTVLILILFLVGSVYAEKIKTEDSILKYGESVDVDFEEGGKIQIRAYENTQIIFTINGKGNGIIIIDEISNKEIKTRIKRRDEKFSHYIIKVGEKAKIDIVESGGPDITIEPRIVHYSEDKKQRNVVLYFNAFFKLRTGQSVEEFKASQNISEITGRSTQEIGEEKNNDYTMFFVVAIIILLIAFVFFKFIKKDNVNEEKPIKIDEEDVYVVKDEKSLKLETKKPINSPEDSGLNIEPKSSSKKKKSK